MGLVSYFVHSRVVEHGYPGPATVLLGPVAHPVASIFGLFAAPVREPVQVYLRHDLVTARAGPFHEPQRLQWAPVVWKGSTRLVKLKSYSI